MEGASEAPKATRAFDFGILRLALRVWAEADSIALRRGWSPRFRLPECSPGNTARVPCLRGGRLFAVAIIAIPGTSDVLLLEDYWEGPKVFANLSRVR